MGWDSAEGPSNQYGTKGTSIGLMAGGGAVMTEPADASHVRDRVCFAEQALSDIYTQVDLLEQRLDTVLTPLPPDSSKRADTPSGQPRSHLVGRLDVLNAGCVMVLERIVRLRQRVEV